MCTNCAVTLTSYIRFSKEISPPLSIPDASVIFFGPDASVISSVIITAIYSKPLLREKRAEQQ